jgi:hypothetical protein
MGGIPPFIWLDMGVVVLSCGLSYMVVNVTPPLLARGRGVCIYYHMGLGREFREFLVVSWPQIANTP